MISLKKIHYVPGLISAVLIPILFWYFINQKYKEINISVIDVGIPKKLSDDKSNYQYTFEPNRNWNYKKIKVDRNKAKENSKFYVSEIKKLQKHNKKNTGIEFILDDKNTYGDFVSLLNDMHIGKHETYAIDLEKTGHLFAVVNYIDPNIQELDIPIFTCGTYYNNTKYEENYLSRTEKFLLALPKESYYIIFGFLIFLNISMLSIKERFQFT